MPRNFGSWLRDYDGDVEWIAQLSKRWNRALVDDYIKASYYWSPEDVARRMAQRSTSKTAIWLHCFRAFHHYNEFRRS